MLAFALACGNKKAARLSQADDTGEERLIKDAERGGGWDKGIREEERMVGGRKTGVGGLQTKCERDAVTSESDFWMKGGVGVE